MWLVIVGITALGGALLLWNGVSRTKATSEYMLRQYAQTLADARRQKKIDLARAAEAEAEADVETVNSPPE